MVKEYKFKFLKENNKDGLTEIVGSGPDARCRQRTEIRGRDALARYRRANLHLLIGSPKDVKTLKGGDPL